MNGRYLLDVSALVGLLWRVHRLHGKANAWFGREQPEVFGCALTELTFVRVSMADRTIAATFAEADALLAAFIQAIGGRYRFVGEMPGVRLLRGRSISGYREISDVYLCELASSHGGRLATLDSGIRHPAADFIG